MRFKKNTKNSNSSSDLYQRAQAYEKQERFIGSDAQNALALYRQILSIRNDDERVIPAIERMQRTLLAKVDQAQANGDWRKGEDLLRSMIRAWPDDARYTARLDALESARAASLLAAEIAQGLSDADGYEAQEQWLLPPGSNVYESLRGVLEKDSTNADALAAMARLQRTLLAEVDQLQSEQAWDEASDLLARMIETWPEEGQYQERIGALESARAASLLAAEIAQGLSDADGYEAQEQWLLPPGSNVYESLRGVLEKDSTNADALAAMARLQRTLLAEVDQLQSEQAWDEASDLLARMIETWPEEGQYQERIDALESARAAVAAGGGDCAGVIGRGRL